MQPVDNLATTLTQLEEQGILVRANSRCSPEVRAAYSTLRPDGLSWFRGFLGGPPLDLDLTLPLDAFVAAFEGQLRGSWGTSGFPEAGPIPARVVGLESHFVALCLRALERWSREKDAVILWDIDETLIGSGSRIRFLRPSSEAVLRYAERQFPNLRHGILSSLAPEWIPAAADLISTILGRSTEFGESGYRYSFRPALDRLDRIDWKEMRVAMERCGIPDCGPGPFDREWPLYVTEFSRVLALHRMRQRGENVKVVDNDLNACFDLANPAENQVSDEARAWLSAMIGDHCATGPHWWPQEAEEWILEWIRIGRREG